MIGMLLNTVNDHVQKQDLTRFPFGKTCLWLYLIITCSSSGIGPPIL